MPYSHMTYLCSVLEGWTGVNNNNCVFFFFFCPCQGRVLLRLAERGLADMHAHTHTHSHLGVRGEVWKAKQVK